MVIAHHIRRDIDNLGQMTPKSRQSRVRWWGLDALDAETIYQILAARVDAPELQECLGNWFEEPPQQPGNLCAAARRPADASAGLRRGVTRTTSTRDLG